MFYLKGLLALVLALTSLTISMYIVANNPDMTQARLWMTYPKELSFSLFCLFALAYVCYSMQDDIRS